MKKIMNTIETKKNQFSKQVTVFLDIDGVLNQKADWKQMYRLNDECVRAFGICMHGSQVVLTSSWKASWSNMESQRTEHIQNLIHALELYQIKIIGRIGNLSRGKAILQYIATHEVKNYITLDDDKSEFKNLIPTEYESLHLYVTDERYGFTKADAKKIKKLLKEYS